MGIKLTLKRGARGTRKLTAIYGEQLICVRYRYDPQKNLRHKTIELVIETQPWKPKPPRAATLVYVRVLPKERVLWKKMQAANARWDSKKQLWRAKYGKIIALGLENRIEGRKSI